MRWVVVNWGNSLIGVYPKGLLPSDSIGDRQGAGKKEQYLAAAPSTNEQPGCSSGLQLFDGHDTEITKSSTAGQDRKRETEKFITGVQACKFVIQWHSIDLCEVHYIQHYCPSPSRHTRCIISLFFLSMYALCTTSQDKAAGTAGSECATSTSTLYSVGKKGHHIMTVCISTDPDMEGMHGLDIPLAQMFFAFNSIHVLVTAQTMPQACGLSSCVTCPSVIHLDTIVQATHLIDTYFTM